jgi:hypothetical protein
MRTVCHVVTSKLSAMWRPTNYLFGLTACFNMYSVTWLANGNWKFFCDRMSCTLSYKLFNPNYGNKTEILRLNTELETEQPAQVITFLTCVRVM